MMEKSGIDNMDNITIDHKTLASHFAKTNEAMRQLKRKWEECQEGLWIVYVKAYNWDMSDINKKEMKYTERECNIALDDIVINTTIVGEFAEYPSVVGDTPHSSTNTESEKEYFRHFSYNDMARCVNDTFED